MKYLSDLASDVITAGIGAHIMFMLRSNIYTLQPAAVWSQSEHTESVSRPA